MRKFHDVDQTEEDKWLELRRGFITTSHFAAIMANLGKSFGNPALEYAMRVAIESKTGRGIESFTNQWMEGGKEKEPDAREMYSNLTFTDVSNGGFMEFGRLGSSSDGLPEEGMAEFKCPKFNTHMERLIKGGYDSKYQWQIRGQMYIYDRPWCDFVSYCPDFPQNKQLYIFRVERDQAEEARMIERLNEFITVVDNYIKHL